MSKSRVAAAVWFLGLAAVGCQALALAARYFQPWLGADYIYPQLFAEDVLAGRYPLAGWTLSSAPYFFPDMAVAIVLRALGGAGTVLPAYVVFTYVMLAVLAGWSLARATQAGWSAWLGGVALVNALLVWQSVSDHAHYLWLLGTVGFHGGAIMLGLANFAVWAGPADSGLSTRRRALGLAVLFLGTISDTLFLTQAALPLGVGLLVQSAWNWRGPRVQAYARTMVGAAGIVALVRIVMAAGGWFNFSKVLRYAPTPSVIGRAAGNFGHDLRVVLFPGMWGLMAFSAVALGVIMLLWWRECRSSRSLPPALKLATGFAVTGLAATTLLPLLTAYWRDANHVRYILPWLLLPGWVGLVWVLPKISGWAAGWKPLAVTAAVWVGLMAVAVPRIESSALTWPYPARQARLDEFLARHGLRFGLSDYWHAHELNTMSRAGVHLFALRPAASAAFWNNNAFWFFGVSDAGQLSAPDYTFIITDGLDEAALIGRFGEPARRESVGELSVWLYPGEGASRLTRELEPEVRGFLRGRPGESRILPTR